MPDMFIRNIPKTRIERMTNYEKDNLVVKEKVNNLSSLTFEVERGEYNAHAFDMLEHKAHVIYEDVTYVIEDLNVREFGDTQYATVECDHFFFDEFMNRQYVYNVMSTAKRSLNEYMNFIIAGTGFTFSIIGTFETKEIENFGGSNPLDLFKQLLEKFEAEFDVVGTDIRLYNRLGSPTGYPFRSKHNIYDISKGGSSRNLSTRLKAFGKEYEDKNISTGTSMNFQTRSSGWADTTDPWWYTDEVGRTFTMKWTGTGINFCYLQAPDGGVWEFKLDDDQTATLSCWAKDASLQKIDLFMDAPEGDHTCIVTFKGDDDDHVPSTGKGKSRGWVRYSDTDVLKTFTPYRLRKDDERYYAVTEVTSPLAAVYGIRVQAPISDERFTNEIELAQYAKEALNDKIEISHEMTYLDYAKAGGPVPPPRIGNTVPYIVEELGLEYPEIRIMEMDRYPETNKSPTIVLGSGRDDYGEAAYNSVKSQIEDVFDTSKGKLNPDVLPAAVKLATELLNNSLTQLEYPVNGGILARDPSDYNKFVVLRSTGLGITRNGGLTYDEAITALGINTSLLTAGQIKTNNIQIIGADDYFYWDGNALMAISPDDVRKFVRLNSGGLYIARGALTIERPDGYKSVSDGILDHQFNIQGASPTFTGDTVTINNRWYQTYNTSFDDCQYFSLKHEGRYLKVQIVALTQFSTVGMQVALTQSGGTRLATYTSYNTNESELSGTKTIMTVDLGVPTGGDFGFAVQMRTLNESRYAQLRVIRTWLEG